MTGKDGRRIARVAAAGVLAAVVMTAGIVRAGIGADRADASGERPLGCPVGDQLVSTVFDGIDLPGGPASPAEALELGVDVLFRDVDTGSAVPIDSGRGWVAYAIGAPAEVDSAIARVEVVGDAWALMAYEACSSWIARHRVGNEEGS